MKNVKLVLEIRMTNECNVLHSRLHQIVYKVYVERMKITQLQLVNTE